jgi:hypothetical protein
MEVEFLNQIDKTGDFVKLFYKIDSKKIELEIGGTALSVYEVYSLKDDELGVTFRPVVTAIFVELEEQEAELIKISIDSEGAKIGGKIVYSDVAIKKITTGKSRKLVQGEYWEIIKNDSGDGRPFRIYNTHQTAYEESGSHDIDLIESFSTKEEAIEFLNKQ